MKILGFIKQGKVFSGLETGWGNGYVCIPREHPFYGKGYSEFVKVKNIDKIPFNGNVMGIFTNAFNEKEKKTRFLLKCLLPFMVGLLLTRK